MKTDSVSRTAADVALVLRYRLPALIVILVLTALLGYKLKDLKLAEDPLASMYLQGHPYVSTLKAIKAMAPEPRLLVGIVKVKQGDIYNAETIKKIDSLTKGLIEIEGILPGGVTTPTKGMMHYNNTAQGLKIESIMGNQWPQTPEEFEALKRRVAVNPMGPGRYVAYDGTAVMLTAKLADINQLAQASYDQLPEKGRPPFAVFKKQQEAQFNAKLVKALDALKAKEDDARHTFLFMGQEVLTHQMTQMGATHIGTAAGIMCALVIVLLVVYFRSVTGVVVPLAAMGVSLVWVLGIYSLAGIELNPLVILFPLVLSLLTLALAVMVLYAYVKAFEGETNKLSAISAAYALAPVRGAILVAGLAMAGTWFAPVPVMKALGLMGVFWIISAYVAVVLFASCLLAYLPAPKLRTSSPAKVRAFSGAVSAIVLLAGLLVLVVGGFAYTRLPIGGNVPGTDYIRANHPWNQCFNLLVNKFMGPQQLLVYVKAKKPGGLVEPEAINAISDFSSYLVNDCGARDSIAFDMMVKMARWTMMDGNPKWQTLPLTRDQIKGLAGMVYEQGGVEDFIDKTYTQATISPFFPNRDARSIDAYAARMQAYIDTHPSPGLEFKLGGGLLGMTKPQNDATRQAYPLVLLAAVMIVLVVGSLALRSFMKGLIITLSIIVAQAALWLIMALAGMPVSMAVASVAAAAVAFGFIFGAALLESGRPVATIAMGAIVVVATVPFVCIGMKFQAVMLIMFGGMALAQMIICLMIASALIRERKTV